MIDMDQNRSLKAELDELLSEDVASVIERERTAFDRLVEPFGKFLVLFGAGNFGRQVLGNLRREGMEPLAFVDNNPLIWGKSVDGVPLFSPQEAAERFGKSAAFLVTIRSHENQHRFVDTKQILQALGCRRVISFMPFLWKYPGTFLPYFYIDLPHKTHENADALKAVFPLWSDEESQHTYLTQLKWRTLADYDRLPAHATEQQYFPESIFSLRDNEVFIDCGAYDGDTIREFLDKAGGCFDRIVAFEPDQQNFQNLSDSIQNLPAGVRERIILLKKAVGREEGKIRFDDVGSPSSRRSEEGAAEVELVSLDHAVRSYKPSYVKLDIEGAEPDALLGARSVIKQHSPLLAVCVYHQQDHLWRIPSLIRSLSSRYRFFLRAHNEEGWELVCYAVPVNRLIA